MKKTKKLIALLLSASMLVGSYAAVPFGAYAESASDAAENIVQWTLPAYLAADAVHSTDVAPTDRTVKIGGVSYDVKALGSISGGISGAAPGEYQNKPGGTASFKVNAAAAGKYDIKVTGLGASDRRIDISVGDSVYPFAADSDYADQWAVISDADSGRTVFTYTASGIELAAGENTVVLGTNADGSWGPDLVGIDIVPADAETDADGMTFKDGVLTVKSAAAEKAMLIYAQYDADNNMKGVSLFDMVFKDGKAQQQLPDAGFDSKIMLWDSLKSSKPCFNLPPIKVKTTAVTPTPDIELPTEPPTPVPTTAAPMTEPPTPVPEKTPFPENAYYVLDFEDASKTYLNTGGGTTSTAELWASEYYFDGLSIASDSNKDIGKHMKYLNNTGKGTRTSYYILPAQAKTVDENKQAAIEFDFKFRNGGTNGNNQIVLIGNASTPIGNGDYEAVNKPAGTAAILKFTQPRDGEGQFIINNSGTSLADATAKSTGYVNDTWAHAKAVMNFETKSVILTVTSLDGSAVYFETSSVSMNDSAESLSQLFVAAARDSSYVCIDNVVVRPLGEGDVTDTYYKVTFNVDGKETTIGVKEGDKIPQLPDTTKTGYIFDGWTDGIVDMLLSNERVLNKPIDADVTFTAVYHLNPEYIEPMVGLDFTKDGFPDGNILKGGADANTPEDNILKLKIIGEIGTDLAEKPDERVNDLDVKWEFNGFRHIASKAADGADAATTDKADSNEYCDSYGEVVYNEADPTTVNFKLKGQAFNFYGRVKATVTYNGKTLEIVRPLAVVPTKIIDANVILPKPGYVENFDWYSDDMVGYAAAISGDNKGAVDVVTGDWAAYGGNSGRGLYLAKDEESGKKFLKLKSTGTNSSSFAVNKLDSAPTGQVIISQDIKFYNNNSALLFKTANPVTWTTGQATTFSLNFTGTGFTFNSNETIAEAAAGKWYHIVLSADITSKLCFAKIYDMEGNLLGQSDNMPFSDAGSTAPVYLCYRTPDNANGELDFNNVKIYVPKIDETNFKTTISDETISIPDAGAADVTTTITATALSTEGYDIIGTAEWGFGESVTDTSSLVITPDATDSHKAVLTVKAGAPAGEIPITVRIGGVTKTLNVNLTSSQDSVQFTSSTSSISIPIETNASQNYTYAAKVVGPTSETDKTPIDIPGKTVTYAVYDKNNANVLTTMPKGVSFDAASGKLTVTSEAAATVFYIRASSTNRSNEPISKAVKVTVHGLAFDFGTGDDGAVVEGYTAVTPTTVYSDATGYGIEGTATAGGSADAENADSDNLAGNFTFKVKVPSAKVYKVVINYKGNAVSEKVNADLSGVILSNAAQSTVEYMIPVIDDVLDLSFSDGNVASIVIEKTDAKAARLKPHIFTVGDSTIANTGSWAYVAEKNYASYADLGLPEIASLSNNGRGGKNLSSYYTGGELRDRILSQICPGDYVMIGNMGTNGMGADFEGSFNYYVNACEAMGAKIILNSYTPHGMVGDYSGGYNKETHTFNAMRKDNYDVIVRRIYEERTKAGGEKYDPKIVGFVDIGKMADAAFNAYVAAASDKDAAANEIISCFGDHNHYSNGTKAAELMINGYGDSADTKGIIRTLYEIISADLKK